MTAPSAQACMSAFAAALVSRDIDVALSLLADDAVLFYSNGTVLQKADFASVMPAAWKVVENYRYATTNVTWLVDTDTTAVVIYGFQWSGVARDQQVSGSGRATRVFHNRGSGWLLAHEHLSGGQAPA